MLHRIFPWLSEDIAIDLGTANTLIHVKGKGLILNEPSVVTVSGDGQNRILAVGREACTMLGRTPAGVRAVRPMKDGVIADLDMAHGMIHGFMVKAKAVVRLGAPRVVVGVPAGATQVERLTISRAITENGAREVYVIDEPVAAALGAGLPVYEPVASMMVDIGGGTSEIAVISLGGLVAGISLKAAGDRMNEAILSMVRKHYGLVIGEATAERIKMEIGAATLPADAEAKSMEVSGRDGATGLPKQVAIAQSKVVEALGETVSVIAQGVASFLETTPPELASDSVRTGIVLAGGGALLPGMDEAIAAATKVAVRVADEPLLCVIKGAGQVLDAHDKRNQTMVPLLKRVA